ncbi:hypothetical protein [Streptomyces sp. BA2]|uniref:hypothetical protein n=1 Tax=Streptomyces sp. BA2 TaxID=436595 RepID=UPI0013234882|nr:hypothetical protein [Streptomyces sp. BA2]MWA07742.1 hypothetical protein [Streptomyces sp. BA2]
MTGSDPDDPTRFYVTNLGAGSSVAVVGGTAYATSALGNALAKVDLDTGDTAPFATMIPTPCAPCGLEPGTGGSLYVLSKEGSLYHVNPNGTVPEFPLVIPAHVNGVAWDGGAHAYVTSDGGVLWRVPLNGMRPKPVATGLSGDAWGVALDKDQAYVTTTIGNLYRVDLTTGHYEAPLATGLGFATGVALDAEGAFYVSAADFDALLYRVNADGTKETIGANSTAYGVALSEDGHAYVITGDGQLWQYAVAMAPAQ